MFSKLIRLTRDSELRTTQGGKQVLQVSGAYNFGWGDNKKTQFVEFALWGDRGAKVIHHLTKGTAIVVNVKDLYVDAYKKNNGDVGASLKGSIVEFEFAGKSEKSAEPQPAQTMDRDSAAEAGFDSFDDDIPF